VLVIQNRVNRAVSPMLHVLCLSLGVATDAAQLWSSRTDLGDGGWPLLEAILFTAALGALATALMTMGWACRVVVADNHVLVVNPLRTYRFHLSQLDKVDAEFVWFPQLHVRGRVIRAVGVEHSLRVSLRRGNHRLTRALDDLARHAQEVEVGPPGVVVRRRPLTRTEIGFLVAWCMLLSLGIARFVI
jgi:hypothetical protein